MINLAKVGRLFYGLAIIAYGIQQIVINDFRPQILPGFPALIHEYSIFAIITGFIMVITGLMLSGLWKVKNAHKIRLSVCLGFYFFALIFLSHLPYLLFVYPHKLSHLGSWGDVLHPLAFSGGAFIMAGSFSDGSSPLKQKHLTASQMHTMTTAGRIFFCTTIILFGCNHFAYDISAMVPKWFGMPVFWSYFGGAALILSGTAILFKILLQPVSLLLAIMLFIWFVLLHVPNALAHPDQDKGNEIVSAFDALLFCGTALMISTEKSRNHIN